MINKTYLLIYISSFRGGVLNSSSLDHEPYKDYKKGLRVTCYLYSRQKVTNLGYLHALYEVESKIDHVGGRHAAGKMPIKNPA